MSRLDEFRPRLTRRDCLRLSTAGVLGGSMSGWMEALAESTAGQPQRRRACILLWMNGGPSHLDTFDLKPGHANGGPFQEIATDVPGIRISEHLPQVARHMSRLAIVRSMTSKEADHGRASYLVRTGRMPEAALQYPTLGSLLSKELGRDSAALPNFVSIAPQRFFAQEAFGPGFLGPVHAPLIVGDNRFDNGQGQDLNGIDNTLKVADLDRPRNIDEASHVARLDMLREVHEEFAASRPGSSSRWNCRKSIGPSSTRVSTMAKTVLTEGFRRRVTGPKRAGRMGSWTRSPATRRATCTTSG